MSDDFEFEDGDDFADENVSSSLKDMWDNNPLLKIGALVVVLGGLYVGYSVFFAGEEEKKGAKSYVSSANELKDAPGQDVDIAYREALETTNAQRADLAEEIGDSSLPTPIGGSRSSLQAPDAPKSVLDPLEEWRQSAEVSRLFHSEEALDDEGLDSDLQNPEVVPLAEPVRPQASIVTNPEAAQQMLDQMHAIVSNKLPEEPQFVGITAVDSPYALMMAAEEATLSDQASAQQVTVDSGNGGQGTDQSSTSSGEEKTLIIPAGNVVYAQLMTELSSDVPGVILAHVLSGPLAGGRALGEFSTEGEYITIQFNAIVKDGVFYTIDGIALDPDTTLAGLATDVDHHYFKRIILPAAAGFITGMAEAMAETTTSVVVTGDVAVEGSTEPDSDEQIAEGIATAAEKVAEILEDEETEITITLAKGTMMGILFMESVTSESIE